MFAILWPQRQSSMHHVGNHLDILPSSHLSNLGTEINPTWFTSTDFCDKRSARKLSLCCGVLASNTPVGTSFLETKPILFPSELCRRCLCFWRLQGSKVLKGAERENVSWLTSIIQYSETVTTQNNSEQHAGRIIRRLALLARASTLLKVLHLLSISPVS